jgi:rRNA maturation endonuclease Nob1
MKVFEKNIVLDFDSPIDQKSASDLSNFEVKTWQLLRSKKYGSERLEQKLLKLTKSQVQVNSLKLSIENLEKVDVFTIDYKIKNVKGELLSGSIQGTIHQLGK